MNDLICKIGNDSTYMFAAAMALVVLLFIVLLVVITSMRVKAYKDRFINTQIDNKDKEMQIFDLQNELQNAKIVNAKNTQELQFFAQTREKLVLTEESFHTLQKSSNELEKLQGKTQAKLEHTEEKLESLIELHRLLQERFDSLHEDNSKLHINNARLLMKLESEARVITEIKNRAKEKNRDS